ncbi:MAG: virulence factor TspB C-terminal domain-related protein [Aquabacterium sp.]
MREGSDVDGAFSRLANRDFPHLRAIWGCGPGFNSLYLPPAPGTVCAKMDTRDDAAGGDDVYTEVQVTRYAAGASQCPDGSAPVGGMCGGGGPPSLSPADVHAAAAAAPNPPVTDWQAAFDNAAKLGYAPDLGYTPTVTGPDIVTSTSTLTSTKTITQPDGSTQTLTETSQEVSHLTYSGSQVAMDTRTVTSTQNPDGSTTTTDKPTASEPDICSAFPNLLGCTNLGTPDTTQVPTSTKNITYTAEDVSLPSGCPTPVSLGRFGELSFQSACDNANTMRPFILAVAAFISLGICVAAVSGVRGT